MRLDLVLECKQSFKFHFQIFSLQGMNARNRTGNWHQNLNGLPHTGMYTSAVRQPHSHKQKDLNIMEVLTIWEAEKSNAEQLGN